VYKAWREERRVTRGIYNLYVDESGSFELPGQPSVVCGVLEDTSAGVDWKAARYELGRALPFFDYPHHAALLNSPSAWLSAVMRQVAPLPSAAPRDRALRRVCEVAARSIHEVPSGQVAALDALRASVAEGRLPEFSTLSQVDAWLSNEQRRCFRELASLVAGYRNQVQDTFRQLFHRYRRGELVGVAALADVEGTSGADAFSGIALNAVRLDAYVRALETLLERVLCLLRGGSGCRVDLWVATRDVELRGYGPIDLTRDALQQIAARAGTFPELSAAHVAAGNRETGVLFTPARGIVRFDAGAPMGLVLADFLSNRLHHRLRGHTRCSLANVCERVATALSLSMLAAPANPTATTTLPTLSADGRARSRIREAFAGGPAAAQGLNPLWNQEQAARWIGFAASHASSS
jgi:hypothetical protein